jgi:hypothetical protein
MILGHEQVRSQIDHFVVQCQSLEGYILYSVDHMVIASYPSMKDFGHGNLGSDERCSPDVRLVSLTAHGPEVQGTMHHLLILFNSTDFKCKPITTLKKKYYHDFSYLEKKNMVKLK